MRSHASTASPTPYWKYSTLLGGGRCDSWAEARFARPKKVARTTAVNAKRAAFLRRSWALEDALNLQFEASSTFVLCTGLTVPESFV